MPGDYDTGGHGIFYKTNVVVGSPISYTVTLIDDNGLSSEVVMSNVPTVVYLNPIVPDGGNGTEVSPVNTMAKAVAFLGGASALPDNATIWVIGTIEVAADTSLEYSASKPLILKRYSSHLGALINVTGGKLALENITIDGQGGLGGFDGSTNAESALITVNSGATLELNSSAIVQNNKNTTTDGGGVNVAGGLLTLIGGTITGNSANNGGGVHIQNSGVLTVTGGTITGNSATSGGGVYVDSGTFNLGAGGIINISSNTLVDGAANNIAYTNAIGNSPVKVTGSISVATGTTIGLSPRVITGGAMLVQAYGGTVNPAHFARDDGGITVIAGTNLIIPTEVYLNPSVAGGTGAADSPVQTMDEAIALLGGAGSLLPGATIWVMGIIEVAADTEWKYSAEKPLIMKRHQSHAGVLVNVPIGMALTLEYITIDGNKTNVSSSSSPLITVEGTSGNRATVTLSTGAILQNNNTSNNSGGGMNVEFGTGNVATSIGIGGVAFSDNASYVKLQSGIINISGNTKSNGDASNIRCTDLTGKSCVQVTGSIDDGTKIGLSPKSGSEAGDMLVYGDSAGLVKLDHFERDDGGKLAMSSNNLIIPVEDIYIDGASVTGNDSNNGSSPITAFKTFEKAKSLINNYNTIWIVGTITVDTTVVVPWDLTEKTGVTVTLLWWRNSS